MQRSNIRRCGKLSASCSWKGAWKSTTVATSPPGAAWVQFVVHGWCCTPRGPMPIWTFFWPTPISGVIATFFWIGRLVMILSVTLRDYNVVNLLTRDILLNLWAG